MFSPWGWAVATGNYVDEMNEKIDSMDTRIEQEFEGMLKVYGISAALMLIVALSMSAYGGLRITKGIKLVEANLHQAAMGDLSFTVSPKLLVRAD